ncbi:MAG: hypothetical protein HDR21_14005 [Lachnospiraceae bacterium]|nr:hypothetical protein [Lachnospiraceae bacterium]
MTKKETTQILAAIISAYPNHDRFESEMAIEGMVDVWASSFQEDDVQLVQLAVAKHIQTNKWPPSIAEIREIIMTIQCPDLIPPDEAWIAVTDLLYVDEFGYQSNELPPLIKDAIDAVGWSNLQEMRRSASRGGKPGLDRVAFMDIYKPLYERERQRMQLAPGIRSTIDRLTETLSGDGSKMIESAREKRQEREALYRQFEHRQFGHLLTTDGEVPDLLGIKDKEESK